VSLKLGQNVTINNTDDIESIIQYFDEIMALYDVIDKYELININANNGNISFDIIFKGCDDAIKIFNVIQRKEVSKYGHIYIPVVSLNYNILNVKLIDKLK
jgi:hypothetical protein